jgi:thiamine biosynthesis lipoprotein
MADEARTTVSFDALGTDNRISAFGPSASAAIEAATERVRQIEEEMSAFLPGSDVSRIGDAAGRGPVPVGADTLSVLEEARRVSRLSDGAFDATARPLSRLWEACRTDACLPTDEEVEAARALVGWDDLTFDAQAGTARLARRGQAVDLGGIAKGYAADEVARELRAHGVEHAIADLGGNVIAVGPRPDGSPWRVGIQNPAAPTGTYLATIGIADETVVTSGVNERFFVLDSRRYHHVIDPRTGWPSESGLLSLTLVGPCSMTADALATALLVMGLERGVDLARSEGLRLVAITTAGDVLSTFPLE